MTDPEWKLAITDDDRIRILWAQKHEAHDLDLGPKDEAMEKLACFLAEHDFGETVQ